MEGGPPISSISSLSYFLVSSKGHPVSMPDRNFSCFPSWCKWYGQHNFWFIYEMEVSKKLFHWCWIEWYGTEWYRMGVNVSWNDLVFSLGSLSHCPIALAWSPNQGVRQLGRGKDMEKCSTCICLSSGFLCSGKTWKWHWRIWCCFSLKCVSKLISKWSSPKW